MKISLEWLKDYVDIPADISPEKLAYDITMRTVEVEGIEDVSKRFEKMVLGRIDKISKHPNADKLKIVDTAVSENEIASIVCGGINLREGMFVAVAHTGALLKVHGEGELQPLTPAKIRGVSSHGMICASDEIGLEDLYPAKEHAEIVDLSQAAEEGAFAPGTPLAEVLGFNDFVLDIDNKSLTNRPDLWGHYGIAREIAAFYNLELKPLPSPDHSKRKSDAADIRIDAPHRCFRYIGTLIDGSKPAVSSPAWMQRRLLAVDQRPISLLVDLTNYLLFSVGQPMHVFDYDKLAGGQIIVREAAAGEKITLLDEEEYELNNNYLVIADGKDPVALGGVMGGDATGVTEGTKRILLESASFEPIGIRRTAAALGLRSESSIRYEKGIDSARTHEASEYFIRLLQDVQPDIIESAYFDCYPTKPESVEVSVGHDFIESRIGQQFSSADVSEKLQALGFSVKHEDGNYRVVVPSWRATGDVSIPEDIVEEVARLHGYENLRFIPPRVELTEPILQPAFSIKRKVLEYLAYSAGMDEVYTYPWVEDEYLEALGISAESCVRLIGPPSKSSSCLRRSLIPAMLHATRQNLRFFDEFSVFELGSVFCPREGEDETTPPTHITTLAGAVVAKEQQEAFLRAKGILEGLFEILPGLNLCLIPAKQEPYWAAKGTALAISSGDEELGHLGLASGLSVHRLGIESAAVALFELNMDVLSSKELVRTEYKPIPRFPVVEYDLAMLFDSTTPWSEVSELALSQHEYVKSVSFLDEYRGKQVPEGKKSIAFKLLLSNPKATLTSETVNSIAEGVIENIKSKLNAEMRTN